MNVAETIISDRLTGLMDFAPAGFAIALHINFTAPRYLFQTYPRDWVNHYSENGLVMQDPTVLWGFENEGKKPWRDMVHMDTAGVLAASAEYGLKFGVTCAHAEGNARSIGSFAHSEADFDDASAQMFFEEVVELHNQTADLQQLSSTASAKLRQAGIDVRAS